MPPVQQQRDRVSLSPVCFLHSSARVHFLDFLFPGLDKSAEPLIPSRSAVRYAFLAFAQFKDLKLTVL